MIHFIIGTRAQLFKMAPIMVECEKRSYDWLYNFFNYLISSIIIPIVFYHQIDGMEWLGFTIKIGEIE